ncbi:hypothetical protein [Shimazuella alba]|uniref:Uncharacterized protein n=1 Tax=Shimazuella alba TaxID=2690964 RepID=A0A6I4VST2_9BACL|nr:hypothetical protein [Shimazuella alba]MXQ53518.1 hypothetical protein [Shimazuella alba]
MSEKTTFTNEMKKRLMRHIPTEFPRGDWKTGVDTLEFITTLLGTTQKKWLIPVPNHLTKLIWDCPNQVKGEYTLHYLWDLGYGRADAIHLPDGKWLVIYQDKKLNKGKFYCVLV